MWPSPSGESAYPGSNPGSINYWLCILGQVTCPLWASVSSPGNEGNTIIYLTGPWGECRLRAENRAESGLVRICSLRLPDRTESLG